MSRLTREDPYDGIGLIRMIWELGHTIAFTQGRWGGDVLTKSDRGIHGNLESALDASSLEWKEKQKELIVTTMIKLRN